MSDLSVVDPKVTPPAAPVVPAVTPPAAPAAAAPATPAPAAVTPATPEPAAKPVNPNSPKWALDRISEESQRARAAEAELARERAGRQSAEELLRRMQAGGGATPPTPTPALAATPATPVTQPRQAEVAAEAARQRFMEDINDTVAKGLSQFGNDSFTGTVNTLTACGATDEFLADVLAVDKANAHTLFQKIAAEPERAATLARMPSRQRIAEITRMSIAQGGTPAAAPANGAPTPAAPAPGVSKAPDPAPAIQAGASAVTEKHWWDEDVDGPELDRIFFDPKRLEQRSGRARR